MNSSIQSIIDSALDGTLSTNSEVEHEASDGFKDSEIVKLAHALDFLGNNLDSIGTDEERLSDLQMLHEKVANETTALARLDPKMANPVGATAYEAGKATGTKAGASSAGIAQAVKNTWQGTGPKWTSAMGGHAGKAALIGGGLLGAGLAGKALFGKEGSYSDHSELSEAELIDYLGYDDAELYVLSKVAGVKGSSLHEVLLEKVAEQFGLGRVMGMINHYSGADKAGVPLPESAKRKMLKQLNAAAQNHPGLTNMPQYKEMQKLVNSLEVGKPVAAATQSQGAKIISTFDGLSPFEQAARAKDDAARAAQANADDAANAARAAEKKGKPPTPAQSGGSGAPPKTPTPKTPTPQAGGAPTPRQVTGQSPRMISGPTTPATPAATKATAATASATPFYKNPKVIGGLAAAAGLGLAAKSILGGNEEQKKTASYEGNDMSVFDEYDFSYLMTKEAKRTSNVPAGQEIAMTPRGRLGRMNPRDYVDQRTRGGVSERVARKTGGRTTNARVAQGRANYATSGSRRRALGVEGSYEIARRNAKSTAKSTAKKTRKAAKALEIGYTVDPKGTGFLQRHGRKLGYGAAGIIGTAGLYGAYQKHKDNVRTGAYRR